MVRSRHRLRPAALPGCARTFLLRALARADNQLRSDKSMDAIPPATTSGYDLWLEHEGLPVIGGHGVEDAVDVPREPWARLGGRGAYLKFPGLEGMTGLFVVEIPGGGALEPERHLYEEIIYVLKGIGSTEVWRDERHKQTFGWAAPTLPWCSTSSTMSTSYWTATTASTTATWPRTTTSAAKASAIARGGSRRTCGRQISSPTREPPIW